MRDGDWRCKKTVFMKRRFLFDHGAGGAGGGAAKGKNVPLIGEVTPEVIAAWKKEQKLSEVHVIKHQGHIAYFKKPGIDELNSYYASCDDEKVTDRWKTIAGDCFIGGSEVMLTDIDSLYVIHSYLSKLLGGLQAEFAKL